MTKEGRYKLHPVSGDTPRKYAVTRSHYVPDLSISLAVFADHIHVLYRDLSINGTS